MMQNGTNVSNSTNTIGSSIKKSSVEFAEPAPIETLNWLIHLQHTRREIAACKELINSAITRSQGKSEYAYFKQGIILKEEGRVQDALETFQKCLKLNRTNGLYLKEVGKCLFNMRRFRLALNAYLEAEQLSPLPDWQLSYSIAQTYRKLGQMDQAKEYAHKSVKAGKQEESYLLLIKMLINEKDLRSALAVANAAVESCPDSTNLLTEAGLLYLKIGQPQYAFERFSQALALDPVCSRALLGVGYITHGHEEYEVALSKYKIAVLYEPESVALWNNIAMCFYSKRKYIAAISCLKRGLWVAPLNWKILFNLGLVHLAANQPASAFNFACAAVNLRPDAAECFELLAFALFELKDNENAVRAIRQACTLSPADPSLTVNAALLTEMAGLPLESLDYLEKFKTQRDTCASDVLNETARMAETLMAIHSTRQVEERQRSSETKPNLNTNSERRLDDDEV